MIWVDFAKNYLKTFASKDLDELRSRFYDNNIVLKDWLGEWRGIDEVLQANAALFSSVDGLWVRIKRVAYNQKTVFVEMDIYGIKDQPIPVVDIIQISDVSGKISSITAYVGEV